jgi:hypothetical protein
VDGVIRAIYNGDWTTERELELEDIEFLIENASRLFPTKPEEITGAGVRCAVWALQVSNLEPSAAVLGLCRGQASVTP